jgi:hypothetical protein
MRRPLIIIAVCLVLAGAAFFLLARHIERKLVDTPYIAGVKHELRAVAAVQEAYRVEHPSYATDIAQLPAKRDSIFGVRVRVVAASIDGFLAEGRHDIWTGRCVIAVGSFVGDSLKAAEPRCYSDVR